jgi:Ca-activated chloride channel family protein
MTPAKSPSSEPRRDANAGRTRRASRQVRRKRETTNPGATVAVLLVGLIVLVVICAACWALTLPIVDRVRDITQDEQDDVARLTLAYSPEKATLVQKLIGDFNARDYQTSDGLPMHVELAEMEPQAMLDAAVAGEFQAMTPDSSVWLPQLDELWAEQAGDERAFIVGQTVYYAVSPVVIAMWRDVALEMGYGSRPLGWADLLARAQSDPDFKWSHPSTSSASGLLATLAEFYAGAGKTWGLTVADVQAPATLDYVGRIERTVRYYGEGEWPIARRVVAEGRDYLDAFVCQEQLVIWANQQGADLVAIYPVEGSLWEDHPLVLLERPELTGVQRQVFAQLVTHLRSDTAQQAVLAAGYRPADPTIPLDAPGSPLTAANGVDPTQPQTPLQIPGGDVVQVVRDVWWYTKRHTNVILVVDTSGSMEGQKIENVQEALRAFVEQIKGPEEAVGLIEFYTFVDELVPLNKLAVNRDELLRAIDGLVADGDTALLDGVLEAYEGLQALGDAERINAIVVMTDGKENYSNISLNRLADTMRRGNETGVPVIVFAIAYGQDADYSTLRVLADATGGQVYEGTLETIRQLYKILSTYF